MKIKKNLPVIGERSKKKIKAKIGKKINEVTGEKIFNLPDDLREIFFSLLPKETK